MLREPIPEAASPPASGQVDVVRLAACLIVAAIVIAALYIGRTVLVPLAIAFLISFALSPLAIWLNRWGLPRIVSVLIVMAFVGFILAGLTLLIGTQIRSLSAQLPTYQWTIRSKFDDIREQMSGPGIFDGAWLTVDTVQSELTPEPPADAQPLPRVQVVEPPASPLHTAVAWLAPALAPLATAGVVLVFVFLALLDRGDLRDRLIRLLGGDLHRSTDALEEAGKRISKYLLMQLLVNVTYGIPMATGLWFIGVPGWLLWGALAALMRFIPYVGALLSAIFPLTLAFAVDPGWSMVIWTLVLIVTLELISNNIVEPLLYGTSTGLSAISLIAAATFWTALWGPVGLILSTPLTVCLLVIGRNLPQLQFLDTLLGSTPVLDVSTRIYQRLIADDPEEAIKIAEEAIAEGTVTEFYNDHGIEILRRVSDAYLATARAEHRLRVANGMDLLLDDLRESHPPAPPPAGPPRIACIGGKWEIDSVACEMLVHALTLDSIDAVERREGIVTTRHVAKLDLDGVEVVCLSYFSRDPEAAARAFCRRLRSRWPACKIVLALWNAPALLLDPERISAMGADEVVTSVAEAVRRIHRVLAPEALQQLQKVEAPADDAARVAALAGTAILDGHAREELDGLAKRAADVFAVKIAMISAVDATREFIIGQNIDLPGNPARDSRDMITMPRHEAICDHVVSSGDVLIVPDTDRDPRFADHPAIELWQARFYAGAPLTTADGMVLGALCLLDPEPRKLTEDEVKLLDAMAVDVVSIITGEEASDQPPPEAKPASNAVGQRVPD
ncbi:AI-2E family transporter [Paracoccus sp. PAR01]|uniref:AI-2E family transporter n=1 Tax=Paracoccus sp. PAR01 TaxID=2769282 RepID=UPI0017818034|nr:AI-2E family transporter [Paracoccus sp. PAR01]MBD9529867.1 AI-2E family transporter [Paracoccus sp. PAR01]